jgi:hypothetical protein
MKSENGEPLGVVSWGEGEEFMGRKVDGKTCVREQKEQGKVWKSVQGNERKGKTQTA